MHGLPQELPLKTTYLGMAEKQETIKKALESPQSIESLKEHQVKELQRLMIEKGLTLDIVLDRYKWVISQKPKIVKASDILKALERVEKLLGISDNSQDQLQIRAMVQSKTPYEITTTLIEITGKTQEYLKKLEEKNNE